MSVGSWTCSTVSTGDGTAPGWLLAVLGTLQITVPPSKQGRVWLAGIGLVIVGMVVSITVNT